VGMYSEIVNSCDALVKDLTGYLQTKDLESVFDLYWAAKDGTLYRVYWPTQPPVTVGGGFFQPGSFSRRGAVRPYRFSGCINVIGGSPSGLKARRGFLCFKEGRLMYAGVS